MLPPLVAPAAAATPAPVAPAATAPAEAAKPVTQQDKMKSCNKKAGDKKLKGDERKQFMSGCLKK